MTNTKDKQSRDATAALEQASAPLGTLSPEQSHAEVQAMAADGQLESLFPPSSCSEATPDLGAFSDLEEAPSRLMTDAEFQAFLERSLG